MGGLQSTEAEPAEGYAVTQDEVSPEASSAEQVVILEDAPTQPEERPAPRSRMRFVQHRPAPEPEPELEELEEPEEPEEIPRVEVAARAEREAPEEAREELQRRQIFKSAMKKEALAQQSPPPSPPSPLSPRIQLDVSGESGDELSEMAGITKPRVGHRAFGSLSASPLQLGPRSPPDSPASSSLSPLSPSSPLSPTSRRERSVHSSNTVLPSFLEREVARAARRHDDRASEAGSVASEEAHADDVKEARLNLRSALIAERKELAGQLGFSRTAQVLVDRLERTIRDLGRRGKSQADPRSPQAPHLSPSGSSTSFLSPLSPHKSPSGFSRDFSFHLGRNDTTLSSQLSGGLSGQLSGGLSGQLSGSVEVAAEAEPEDEDYDSNDEEAMQTRYKERCSAQVITKLRNTLAEEGLLIPKEPEDEKEKQYHEKQVKQEVSSYQEIIASRLARLGAKQSAPLRPSSNPSEAVKEGLLRYHGACEKLGKLYAFEPQATASDPAYEQRQISRFVRDLS